MWKLNILCIMGGKMNEAESIVHGGVIGAKDPKVG